MSILKVFAAIFVLAAIGIGLVSLDKYVKKAVPVSQTMAILELVDVPIWVNEPLKEKIYRAAISYGEDLKLDEDAAKSVQQNIQTLVAWMDDVRVQTTNDRLLIEGRWRRPVALVKDGPRSFYVDDELVVLDFVPMPNLHIVNVKGLSAAGDAPPAGEVWPLDDLTAAIIILTKLEQMDEFITPDKPLLYKIDSIDVSNFDGRRNNREPHITLYTKNNTKIIWGAEFGTWQRYLEAPDEEKLTNLYNYYKQQNATLSNVKYIDLRSQQYNISLPVDKY